MALRITLSRNGVLPNLTSLSRSNYGCRHFSSLVGTHSTSIRIEKRQQEYIPTMYDIGVVPGSLKAQRQISSMTEILPDFVKNYSIWGGSAILLKTFHAQNVPYWGCMSLTNLLVRSSLFPLVIRGAKTSARFSRVAPEVQFLFSSYINDAKKLKDANAPPSQRLQLLYATWQTLTGIWKLNKVNPFDVMKSPLMQIPVFWYFSVDIRKLINGGDPELAQELTESGFLWVMDLTEPDPWYGLPILSGMLLYLNVEVAVGKQTLSGETASKSNLAKYLKDGFQSLAIFMPCFMSQSPAGVQIYLLTSFTFTLFQGAALRNDGFRDMVGLPPRNAPPPEGKYVKEFIALNKIDRETFGIIAPSHSNTYRPYAQMFTKQELEEMEKEKEKKSKVEVSNAVRCIQAPEFQPSYEPSPTFLIVDQLKNMEMKKTPQKTEDTSKSLDELPEILPTPDEVMVRHQMSKRYLHISLLLKQLKLSYLLSFPLSINPSRY